MTMTVDMLEKMLISEVENLHLRIDTLGDIIAAVNERLDRIDRHIQLLWNAIDGLSEKFITKEEAKRFATKDDLKQLITKEDAKQFATKEDLKSLATKDDLKAFATKEDLGNVMRVLERIAVKVGV